MICQVCGTLNDPEQDICRKCQSKLLIVSGTREAFDEGGSHGESVSLEEHLLERVSVLEEIVKRSAETLRNLLQALNRQEKNGFVVQTGLLALKDLLERKGQLVEDEFVDLWESRVDHHMAAMEKRERFLERRERILGGFSGSRSDRFRALLGEAEMAFFSLDPGRGVRSLEEAFRLDRNNAELALFLGETYFNEGETARAVTALKQVLVREPDRFEALVYAGILENEVGRSERAIDYLKRAVAARPDAFLPYFALGGLFASRGQYAKAEGCLKKAVAIEENPQALALLGTLAYERGRLNDAIETLERAVKLDPADEEAIYLLGLSYLDRGWTQKATERFQEALELNPNRIEYQEAAKLLVPTGTRVLPRVTGEAARLAKRAEAMAAKDPRRALLYYRRALKLAPENATILIGYALVSSALGQTAEAVATTKRVLATEPSEIVAAAAYATLLEALRAQGKFREGSRVASEMLGAVRSNYAKSIAYFQRASVLAEMGEDLDEALAAADLSLKLSPREMRHFPLAAKGWVHYKRREYKSAVECLKRAADLSETPTGLTHLGLACLAVGDARGARQAFGRAKLRGVRHGERRGGLESKMLDQIRRNLQLTDKIAKGKKLRLR